MQTQFCTEASNHLHYEKFHTMPDWLFCTTFNFESKSKIDLIKFINDAQVCLLLCFALHCVQFANSAAKYITYLNKSNYKHAYNLAVAVAPTITEADKQRQFTGQSMHLRIHRFDIYRHRMKRKLNAHQEWSMHTFNIN